jgi:TAK1-binding protein 1
MSLFFKSESVTEHWTDDLPICTQSGVGFSPNTKYRADGGRREEHEFEDQSFHFHFVDKDCYLYGVFDGYNGRAAAEFAAQRLPAELLFGQLTGTVKTMEIDRFNLIY